MGMLVAAAVAFVLGYAVGAIPVAWLVVRRRAGVDMRPRGIGGTGTVNAAAVAGVQAAVVAAALELAKGAIVGVAARLYSPSGWFVATAIAGCVAGDAFPLLLRRPGRGVLPLVSGLLVALPVAGIITALTALPAAAIPQARGRVYETVVLIAVPIGLGIGTRDWRSLVPAAIIVAMLLARSALRRRRRSGLVTAPAWPWGVVVDGGATPPERPTRQTPRPWVS